MATTVHLDVSDTTLRFALTYVLEAAGYRRATDRSSADMLIGDRRSLDAPPRSPIDALVVDPSPAACQHALDTIIEGGTRTAICSDDPETLVSALEAARTGSIVLPTRLVENARRAPRLPKRLALTLHLILAGCTNFHIARQLSESQSTVKRDINELLTRFGVANRTALAAAAQAAGFSPRTLSPEAESSLPKM